ncbi:MAG TPA: response regulator transcription factor [bacterium]|nr:response regulator transcription factor [bacterium]
MTSTTSDWPRSVDGAMPTILVVDDEPQIVELLRSYLQRDGFTVEQAADGEAALSAVARGHPDLVVLDLMLPRVDGREVCRRIRAEGTTPIIMLTARDEETDKLLGLELGADDYITKPFSPREVVARVRAVLRRGVREGASVIHAGDLTIDLRAHEVTLGARRLELTPTEFRLLETLASHPNQVFTRMQLIDRVQGHAFEGYERTVDAHIKNLRGKVEPDPRTPRYVLTVYGVGYKFSGGEDHRA